MTCAQVIHLDPACPTVRVVLQGVQVNVMLKPDRLHTCPSQLRIGRIIRLHRLKMQHYNGRAQGIVSGSSGVSYALAEAR